MSLRQILKSILFFLHLDLTKNQRYDRQTCRIMQRILTNESHCIDIGCHKGEMLGWILKFSPKGPHWAFEPLPAFYQFLKEKFSSSPIKILPYALSDNIGEETFNYVVNAPAYSGLKKRKYDIQNPDIQHITVNTEKLDNLIPTDIRINFIKLDVEGGEYQVLKGSAALLKRDKPFLIFEFGLGAADCYGTQPEMMWDLINDCNLKISTLYGFLHHQDSLQKQEFVNHYHSGTHFYFIAHP